MKNTELNSVENLGGGCGGGCSTPAPTPTPTPTPTPVTKPPLELHICMGLNACKGHDRYGTNACAGMGYCATAQAHTCHTLNNCRGQGGCGLYGDGEEQNFPGANDCAWQGSCAVPVQAERYSTQGPNKGKSVWVLARKLFEERMRKANRDFGPSPYKCGPPQSWLTQILGSYDSCGNSGDKYCSFGFNSPAKDAQELCQNSQPPQPPHMCGSSAKETNHCGGSSQSNHCGASSTGETNKSVNANKTSDE
ncbi:MAG: hypothetical protein M3384_00845 [Acidobacteriota bacterium]|nr:hypothetical protein [Acidobacteriota bacterium]